MIRQQRNDDGGRCMIHALVDRQAGKNNNRISIEDEVLARDVTALTYIGKSPMPDSFLS